MSVFVVMEHSAALEEFSKSNPGFAQMFAAEFGADDEDMSAAGGGMIEAMKKIYRTTFDNCLEHSKTKVPEHIRRPVSFDQARDNESSGPFSMHLLSMTDRNSQRHVRTCPLPRSFPHVRNRS